MFEIGVVFWAGRDRLADMMALGVKCGQVVVPGEFELSPASADRFKAELDAAGFNLGAVFAAFDGEDYADIPTVERTVGFVPPATREARAQRFLAVSDFAARLGAPEIACHIGCVPHDASHPDYVGVRDLVRHICDHAAKYGQTFGLETGQEPADVLLAFFRNVDRKNLRINFDPANMIMYGSGEPIEALRQLGPHVVSVHAKDGVWPPQGVAGALGSERPLGQGDVGMDRFVRTLEEIGFRGPLNIERECEDREARMSDLRMAVGLLRGLAAAS